MKKLILIAGILILFSNISVYGSDEIKTQTQTQNSGKNYKCGFALSWGGYQSPSYEDRFGDSTSIGFILFGEFLYGNKTLGLRPSILGNLGIKEDRDRKNDSSSVTANGSVATGLDIRFYPLTHSKWLPGLSIFVGPQIGVVFNSLKRVVLSMSYGYEYEFKMGLSLGVKGGTGFNFKGYSNESERFITHCVIGYLGYNFAKLI